MFTQQVCTILSAEFEKMLTEQIKLAVATQNRMIQQILEKENEDMDKKIEKLENLEKKVEKVVKEKKEKVEKKVEEKKEKVEEKKEKVVKEKNPCDFILKKGKNSGNECGKPAKEGSKCKNHSDTESDSDEDITIIVPTCKFIFKKGQRKDMECGKKTKTGNFCNLHQNKEETQDYLKKLVEDDITTVSEFVYNGITYYIDNNGTANELINGEYVDVGCKVGTQIIFDEE